MSITALEIQEVRFGEVKKGYDPNEVDEFLERVAADVDTLNRALGEAAARIKVAEARAEEAEKRAAQAPRTPIADTSKAKVSERDALSEDIISKAFIAAQKSADALQEDARREAEKVFHEAEAKGRDIVREALSEKQKTLSELDRLRESSEHFRTEYLALLKHFQADAQKRLSVFDEVVPAKTGADKLTKEQEKLLAANDASVVAAKDVAAAAAAPAAAAAAARPPAATTPAARKPVALTLDEDEDLDIEEID
ncbi:MAG: DivIVA domain-containing protein [Coriobacteriales bacterium]|jgi:cell division initiation protein|nr:DivIVA domain-containing protein [Coriobacteriales bacterium]